MESLKVRCPAKINLTLEITGMRADGFHEIRSLMQTISLYDFLTIAKKQSAITISGTSCEIPYDEKNIAFKAAQKFFEISGLNFGAEIYIEKNIPVCAGLAGGSTNAAGTLLGLNELYGAPLNREVLHEICASLGSDLNFCLEGGAKIASGRGEILTDYAFKEYDVSLVKPKNLAVSAKEAYTLYAELDKKPKRNTFPFNALQSPVLKAYPQLQRFENAGLTMSGSGPTFFCLSKVLPQLDYEGCEVYENLTTIPNGVEIFLNN